MTEGSPTQEIAANRTLRTKGPTGKSQTTDSKLDLRRLGELSPNQLDSHVMFSFMPFLQADISHLSEDKAQFLDTQGSFKIPGMQSLNEFIRVYFQNVHPILPLIDESAFWKMYTRKTGSSRDMSLFVFQAMLFAASSVSFLRWSVLHTLADSMV